METDPTRLCQNLFNLLGNAIKFTEQGHVALVVDTKSEGVSRYLVFSVIDTGVGISEAEQARLFSPFMQGDGSMNRRHGGIGLGLAIGRRLAPMLGGDISVQTELEGGSVFTATIQLFSQDSEISHDKLPAKPFCEPDHPP